MSANFQFSFSSSLIFSHAYLAYRYRWESWALEVWMEVAVNLLKTTHAKECQQFPLSERLQTWEALVKPWWTKWQNYYHKTTLHLKMDLVLDLVWARLPSSGWSSSWTYQHVQTLCIALPQSISVSPSWQRLGEPSFQQNSDKRKDLHCLHDNHSESFPWRRHKSCSEWFLMTTRLR